MAKPPAAPPPPPPGSNFNLTREQLEDIDRRTKAILALEAQRDAINADINGERKAIRAHGIDLDAWRASKRRLAMDPDDRAQFDRSRELVDQALGIPVQGDLFEAPEPEGRVPGGPGRPH